MRTSLFSPRTVRPGFTLIELLLVIGIIAILASIVIVAINPTKQLGNARNAQRRSDVNTIVNAVYQYAIDKNNLPSGIPQTPATAKWICRTGTGFTVCGVSGASSGKFLRLAVLSGTYLVSLPIDPKLSANTATGSTGYQIVQDANNRVTVTAPLAEQGENISVTR